MKLINGSYDDKLHFYATIKTRSINHGTANIIKILNLVNEVSLFLYGFVLSGLQISVSSIKR